MKNIVKKKIWAVLLCLALSFQFCSVKPFFGLGTRLNNLFGQVFRSRNVGILFGVVVACGIYGLIRRSGALAGGPDDNPEIVNCGICYENKVESEFTRLSCGHTYCRNCLENKVDEAISRKTTTNLRCRRCASKIEPIDIRKITNDNNVKTFLCGEIATNEWLAKVENLKHCPNSGCKFVFTSDGPQSFTCPSCNSNYCSHCLFSHPEEVLCERAARDRSNDANKVKTDKKEEKRTNIPVKPKEKRQCDICFGDEEDYCELSCKHSFCNGCLGRMVDMAIQEKNTGNLNCPTCREPFEYSKIREITKNDLEKVNDLSDIAFKEFLAKCKNAKHCPTPNCSYSYLFNEGEAPFSTRCPDCWEQYCSSCLTAHGQNVSCEDARNFRKLGSNKDKANVASEEWLKSNTKACPICKIDIQKNEGCNHMTCKCGHEFCWLCLVPFKGELNERTERYDHPNNGCPSINSLFNE